MRRTRRTAVAVAGAAALLAGCSQAEKPSAAPATVAAKPAPARGLKIAMIAKSSTNPVFLAARTGALAAARELQQEHGVPVEIAWLTPPTEDGQVQAQRIAQAVAEGMIAILISCSDAGKVTGAINAMLGALLIVLIRQSIRTLRFDQNYEWIIVGCAIIIAVVLDQSGTRLQARRLAREAAQQEAKA